MNYTVECDERAGIIVVRVQGELTTAMAAEYSMAAQAMGTERGISRFLIDVRQARNVETTLSNYQFAYETLPETHVARSNRVAVLHEPGDHSHDFVETVSRNAGFNVRMFTRYDLAMGWLLAPPLGTVPDAALPHTREHE